MGLVVDYLDRTLAAAEFQDVGAHMHRCPPCVRFVDSYCKTSTLCQRVLKVPPPVELGGRLQAFLRSQLAMACNVGGRAKRG